jgi:hypothetical protein
MKRKRPPPLGQGGVGEPAPIGASVRSPYPYSNPKNLRHHERGCALLPLATRGGDQAALLVCCEGRLQGPVSGVGECNKS